MEMEWRHQWLLKLKDRINSNYVLDLLTRSLGMRSHPQTPRYATM